MSISTNDVTKRQHVCLGVRLGPPNTPLIFAKRLCDVFDDEIDRIAKEVGSRAKVFRFVKHDKKLVRFYLPLQPSNPDERVWSVIRTRSDKSASNLPTHLRAIADANPLLRGIIDRVDFNATTHGVRDLAAHGRRRRNSRPIASNATISA
jgi:HsdM N-terminal domain